MAVTLFILAFGLVMVYSSSAVLSYMEHGFNYFYFQRQVAWSVLGLVAFFFLSNFSYEKLRRFSRLAVIGAVILLLAVFIPGVGVEINFARRWLGIAGLTLQPSELAKLAVILYVSHLLTEKKEKIHSFSRGILPPLLVTGLVSGLILLQPDLGTSVAIAASTLFLLFIAGARSLHLAGLLAAGAPALWWAIFSEPYRRQRFLAFLDPWADPLDTGYHIIQSLYAIGSGGLLGLGLGQSRQKYLYLPEPQTDFIFAIIAEELGFIGGLLLISLFSVFIWRAFRVALKAPDPFSTLLAAGISTMLGLQTLINIGVVTGSMPIKGMPLPFVSFGGTSLLFCLAGTGILVNISRYARE
ncbi:MAG: putative lipid II flippase FtsW [Firmicutes bacterium]|nr:putative lipid II flippase FtsW [Bacillota bacterium]